MNPQDPQQNFNQQHPDQNYDPKQHVGNELSVMQPGEKHICDIKRHPIGIIGTYIAIGLILIVIGAMAFGLPKIMSDSGSIASSTAAHVGVVIFIIFAALCAVFGLISTKVYWGNQWIVTSDSVTQVSQKSLFNRQSAQLSLGNVEDVTAEQNGLFAQMFKYGVLKVETAGHHEKFAFLFCPNPNFYARCILEAREAYEMELHGRQREDQPAYSMSSNLPVAPQQPPDQQPYPPQDQPPSQDSGFRTNY